MASEQRVDLIIAARDEATAVIRQAGASLDTLTQAQQRAGAAMTGLSQAQQGAAASASVLAQARLQAGAASQGQSEAAQRLAAQLQAETQRRDVLLAKLNLERERLAQVTQKYGEASLEARRFDLALQAQAQALQRAEQRVGALQTRLAGLGLQQRQATTAPPGGGAQDLSTVAGALAGGLSGLASMAGMTGIMQLGRVIGGAVSEMASLGLQTERVRVGLESLAGSGADEMLSRLRQASGGAVGDLSLMLSANRAMMLGVTRDAETMGRLLEVAAARGRALGLSTEQAFSDIVTGIGRMSPLILDNLGIVVGGEQAFDRYAASLNKTAAQLSEVEKKQFLVNKVIADGANLPGVTPLGQEQMSAATENLKASLGRAFMGSFAGEMYRAFTRDWAQDAQAVADYFGRIAQGRQELSAFAAQMATLNEHGRLSAEQYAALEDGIGRLATKVAWGKLSHAELTAEISRLRASVPGVTRAWSEWEGEIHVVDSAISATQARLEQMDGRRYRAELQIAITTEQAAAKGYGIPLDPWLRGRRGRDMTGGETVADDIARDNRALAEAQRANELAAQAQRDYNYQTADTAGKLAILNGELARATAGSAEYYSILSQIDQVQREQADAAERIARAQRNYHYQIADTSGQLRILEGELAKATVGSAEYYDILSQIDQVKDAQARAGARATQGPARDAEAAARELRSRVEGLLTPTDVTSDDYLAAKFGLYESSWDEYVRRLRSAATDARSAWRDMIPADILAQGQERVSLWVAQQEQAFYAGQLPDQIDWGAFERQFRAQEAQRAAKENLINEAMRRVSGMGLSANVADVSRALGLQQAPGQETGARIATGFAEGVTGIDLGGNLVSSFERQMQGHADRWVKQGQWAMTQIMDGMIREMDALGPRFVGALLPALLQEMNRQGPRP